MMKTLRRPDTPTLDIGMAPFATRFSATAQIAVMLVAFSAATVFAGPEIPGAVQSKPIAIVGAEIHPVSAAPIPNGTIVFDEGRITAVGADVEVPADAERIDGTGLRVYPALFDSHSNIGLVEINAVRATVDTHEPGDFNPNVRAHVAVNPDSELIPVTRANGVLLALTVPQGGMVAGKSAVLQLDGWTWEDLTLQPETGLHIDWPRMSPAVQAERSDGDAGPASSASQGLLRLEKLFDDAKAYRDARQADPVRHARDARWEAMLPVLSREQPVIVTADEAQQIQAAVSFAARHAVRLIVYGGYDAEYCADLLKQHDVPVIVGGVYRLPMRRGDDYDAPYTLPERLRQAGVRFCIAGAGRFGASNVRNLPYHAATAVAYGLPQDEALRAITLAPAEILGVANRVGSLETGKDATLFVADGDPLETATQVRAAFIQGRSVDLSSRHVRLWKKYGEKLRRIREAPDAPGANGEPADK